MKTEICNSVVPKTPDLILALDLLEATLSTLEDSNQCVIEKLRPVLNRGEGAGQDGCNADQVSYAAPITDRLGVLQRRVSALIDRQREEILDRLEI
ncbi:hypothetical protein [Burkholderia gladioli]|uniref:hypothetical protein n=1 Tax=Burkholderia gladioli TaxID=28095 RepID=UPI0016417BF6|nr:hypothetical protein [Burkholderia gladioli]